MVLSLKDKLVECVSQLVPLMDSNKHWKVEKFV